MSARAASLACVALACLARSGRADYLMAESWGAAGQCLGNAPFVQRASPQGCVRTGPSSSSNIQCVNATFAYALDYATSDCVAAPTLQTALTFTAGCAVQTGFASRTTCVAGTWTPPTVPDAGTALYEIFEANFAGGATCANLATSLTGTVTTFVLDQCFPTKADESRMYQCNGTSLIAVAYPPGCAAGSARPIMANDVQPLGCYADAFTVSTTACTATPSGGNNGLLPFANSLSTAAQAGIAVGSIALLITMAGTGILLRRRHLARYRTSAATTNPASKGSSAAAESSPLMMSAS